MTEQQLDATRYSEDLLKKHRDARGPLDDLLAWYAITLPATDAEIAARVMEVRAYWRTIAVRGDRLAQVAQIFLTADQQLQRKHGARMLTTAWWQERQLGTEAAAGAQQLNVPVSIYLSDEGIHEQVEVAVRQWLATADISVDAQASALWDRGSGPLRLSRKPSAHQPARTRS